MTHYWNRVFAVFQPSGRTFSALLLLLGLLPAAVFAAPKLETVPAEPLRQAIQTNEQVTFRLRYTDPNGDPIKKADALFIDDSQSGHLPHTATDIDGTDTATGVTISWQVNGLTQGPHQAYFQVTAPTGSVARYPSETSNYFAFGVEAPATKYIELGGGIVICLAIIPFLTYLLFRSVNPRSDPSRAARGALFLGILAVCALFIYLFAGVIGTLLVIAIAVIAAIIGLIIVFGRR